jgi:hypothetical protein
LFVSAAFASCRDPLLNIMISISVIFAESGSGIGQESVKTPSLNGLNAGSLTDAGWNQ